jgi:hypothetical protein
MNKIFFLWLFSFLKLSKLATGHECLVFGRSGYPMVGTGIRYNPNTARGSVFGGSLYMKRFFFHALKIGTL